MLIGLIDFLPVIQNSTRIEKLKMVSPLRKLCFNNLNNKITSTLYITTRYGHHLRGKPPGIARSLQDRFDGIKMFKQIPIKIPCEVIL